MSSQAKVDPMAPKAEKTNKELSQMLRVEADESITADAERALKELGQRLEHRELITKEEVRKSREFILKKCNEGASDQIVAACPAVSRKLQGMSFYAALLIRDGQDSALARLIVMLSEGVASCARRSAGSGSSQSPYGCAGGDDCDAA